MYARYFKRPLDVLLSASALLLLSPVLGLLALWVKLDSPGPVLFKQRRIGRNGTEFLILKFRTMRSDTPADVPTHLMRDPEAYITKAGAFLRKTSLDELPQLINIFLGHMSFVGPRPALWNQDDLMELRRQNGSDRLRPGLTGWAQINGRDELEISVKAAFDGEYARRISFGFDASIFFKTFLSVLHREGVAEGGPKAADSPEEPKP